MVSFAQVLIVTGIILGNIDWLLDLAYAASTTFENDALSRACLIFVIAQPVFYLFVFILYVASHPDTGTGKERCKKIVLSPLYMIL